MVFFMAVRGHSHVGQSQPGGCPVLRATLTSISARMRSRSDFAGSGLTGASTRGADPTRRSGLRSLRSTAGTSRTPGTSSARFSPLSPLHRLRIHSERLNPSASAAARHLFASASGIRSLTVWSLSMWLHSLVVATKSSGICGYKWTIVATPLVTNWGWVAGGCLALVRASLFFLGAGFGVFFWGPASAGRVFFFRSIRSPILRRSLARRKSCLINLLYVYLEFAYSLCFLHARIPSLLAPVSPLLIAYYSASTRAFSLHRRIIGAAFSWRSHSTPDQNLRVLSNENSRRQRRKNARRRTSNFRLPI
jgi:hypothetical protein